MTKCIKIYCVSASHHFRANLKIKMDTQSTVFINEIITCKSNSVSWYMSTVLVHGSGGIANTSTMSWKEALCRACCDLIG
jgi:hypothetical protein